MGKRTALCRVQGGDPLKLLTPRWAGEAAWVYTSTFGGGLVAGDDVSLELTVGEGASLVASTQASTKVYRCPAGVVTRQALHAQVADGGSLFVLPDPVTPFADADYRQEQVFDLHGGANLVSLEWMTSGRLAMGERWAFRGYATRTRIRIDGRLAALDALRLDAMDDEAAAMSVGAYHCFATVFIVGSQLLDGAEGVLRAVAREPLQRGGDMVAAVSPLGTHGGCVLRVAGVRTEGVARYLQEKLAFVTGRLGESPWQRKW